MARIHDITAKQRALAVLLRREFKYSYRNIALKTNMSKTSVQRVIKRFDTKNTIPKTSRNLIKVGVNHWQNEMSTNLKEQSSNSEKKVLISQLRNIVLNLADLPVYSNTYRCNIT